jgi:hypothetical protein
MKLVTLSRTGTTIFVVKMTFENSLILRRSSYESFDLVHIRP